jgi:2-keto-4-pentenoate hydratase
MMNAQGQQRASDLLWDRWLHGRKLPELPADLRPGTREEGYAIQALLEGHSAAPLFGWKIAATSAAGQTHIGVDGPIAGRLLAERAQASGGSMSLEGNGMRVAEPEFAFRMGRDLAPRAKLYASDEVLDAVASLHPAIEVPDSRYVDFVRVGAPQLIADNACAHHFVLGDATPANWRVMDLVEHAVIGEVEGKTRREGKGENVLGDPRVALTWLANELSRLSITLRSGQIITTGTCMVPLSVFAGDRVSADFGTLGRVSVAFTDR